MQQDIVGVVDPLVAAPTVAVVPLPDAVAVEVLKVTLYGYGTFTLFGHDCAPAYALLQEE